MSSRQDEHQRRRGMFIGPAFQLSGGSNLDAENTFSGAAIIGPGVGGTPSTAGQPIGLLMALTKAT